MLRMDTTSPIADPLGQINRLLVEVAELDPAEAVAPLAEVAELLEAVLDGGADD